MANYVAPEHKVAVVNAAARRIAAAEFEHRSPTIWDLQVVNNWRTAHDYPLNGIHMTLKNRVAQIGSRGSFTAQRVKRLESIVTKLHDRPTMKLSQMQDIGGCRAVLPNLRAVSALYSRYVNEPVVHEFLQPKDYIQEPNEITGYRSLHLRFRFTGSAKSFLWDGLKIEMQLRSALQHQWATAVETAGTLSDQELKSKRGDPEWIRFFALVSAAFADREGTPAVPNCPQVYSELLREIRELDSQHQITEKLDQYAAVITEFRRTPSASHYVIVLDPVTRRVEIFEFTKSQTALSAALMLTLEQERPAPAQVVRVAVSSLRTLKRAYPNYFLDTKLFVNHVRALGNGLQSRVAY